MRNFNLNLDSVEHGLDLPKLKPSTDVAPEPIHKEAPVPAVAAWKRQVMAMRAVALVSDRELSFETMENPLKPEAYDHMFKATDLELARLSGSEHCLRCIDLHEANPKDECDRLVSEHTQDSRRTATLTLGIAQYQPADGGTRKRRRTGAELGTWFPSADRSGKRINQGYGDDLSFLPASFPVVCKQSTKFMRFTDDMSASWEVSQVCMITHGCLTCGPVVLAVLGYEHIYRGCCKCSSCWCC